MSEPIEKTAAGATRTLFGSLGFILLMVGVEGMTGIAPLPLLWAIPLIAIGVFCVYAAVFWENAKRIFSVETQVAIGRFAQSQITKFGMLFLVLATIILSPFFEQHRWPFSYPADPAIYAENQNLRKALQLAGRDKEPADKWRFAAILRQTGRAVPCSYILQYSAQASSTVSFWKELFQAGGWLENSSGGGSGAFQPGITLRIVGEQSHCAGVLQRALADVYPNPPAKIASNQQTEFLISCTRGGNDCVQVEMDY